MIDSIVAPGASDEYVIARERLLVSERALRDQIEAVAQQRRALPEGPEVTDYEFVSEDGSVRLSQLFTRGTEPYLTMWHLMYWADDDEFCPSCSAWIDGLDGAAQHIERRVNLVISTRAPFPRLREWAKQRGWRRLRLLSAIGDKLPIAIGAQHANGDPDATVAVFSNTGGRLRHVYTQHPAENGKAARLLDQLTPIWNLFDLIPSGRDEFELSNDILPDK